MFKRVTLGNDQIARATRADRLRTRRQDTAAWPFTGLNKLTVSRNQHSVLRMLWDSRCAAAAAGRDSNIIQSGAVGSAGRKNDRGQRLRKRLQAQSRNLTSSIGHEDARYRATDFGARPVDWTGFGGNGHMATRSRLYLETRDRQRVA